MHEENNLRKELLPAEVSTPKAGILLGNPKNRLQESLNQQIQNNKSIMQTV